MSWNPPPPHPALRAGQHPTDVPGGGGPPPPHQQHQQPRYRPPQVRNATTTPPRDTNQQQQQRYDDYASPPAGVAPQHTTPSSRNRDGRSTSANPRSSSEHTPTPPPPPPPPSIARTASPASTVTGTPSASLAAGTAASAAAMKPRIRRRNRMITSCLECRRRKLKCDRCHPCTNCARLKRDCVFLAPSLDPQAKMRLAELKEKMGEMERVLERDVAGGQQREVGSGGVEEDEAGGAAVHAAGAMTDVRDSTGGGRDDEATAAAPEDEKDLRPTALAVLDAAYEDEADDGTLDLGVRLGKLRLSERIGGYYRPRMADELTLTLATLTFSGTSEASIPRLRDILPEKNHSWLNPGPTYIAPLSDMFFIGSQREFSLFDLLPSRVAADRLIEQYWTAVDPVAKIVHRPSFEMQYEQFWACIAHGAEPSYSLQALVFAAQLSAVVSMSEHLVLSIFDTPQRSLVENFQLGTEMALGKAQFLKTSKTQTLQALVMYLIPMCRQEISRAHSTLVGTAIRLAECMGFHRDPEEYGLGAIETHVRRMIWYQICYLDLRTSEMQ
ncbi:hypothetical protein AJ80_08478, partial [Polytolypa hystricis UAMH7299]